MAPALSATITGIGGLSREQCDHWDHLCSTRPELESAFYSRKFAECIAAARTDVRVCVIRQSGEPVAYLPFQFPSRIARLLGSAERIGGHLCDYFGLVAEPDFRIDPANLLEVSGLTKIEFTHLDESQLLLGLSGQHSSTGIRYDLSGGGALFWEDLKKREREFHAHTFRQMRRAERELGPLKFTFKAQSVEEELCRVISLKRQQYQSTRVTDALLTAWSQRALHSLGRSTDPLCEGIVSVLHAGDTWLASHFGLRSRGVLHYWFPVYNPEAARVSPGRLLLKALIDCSEEEGIRLIDDGEANESQRQKHQLGNAKHQYFRGEWETNRAIRLVGRLESGLRWRFRFWRGNFVP